MTFFKYILFQMKQKKKQEFFKMKMEIQIIMVKPNSNMNWFNSSFRAALSSNRRKQGFPNSLLTSWKFKCYLS